MIRAAPDQGRVIWSGAEGKRGVLSRAHLVPTMRERKAPAARAADEPRGRLDALGCPFVGAFGNGYFLKITFSTFWVLLCF
jgi:hypothetical protein